MIRTKSTNKIFSNTIMLYLLTFAKMVFPLITLPYLTRILSVPSYAVVSYVKAFMVYIQIILDFGFILSATKKIVQAKDKEEIGKITGTTIEAKLLISAVLFIFVCLFSLTIDILKNNYVYVIISFFSYALTVFLPDFLFRGIEKMHIITIRFVIMRGISTVLTFFVVKGDADLIFIPLLDVIGTVVAVVWTWTEIHKLDIKLKFSPIKEVLSLLKYSFVYFISDAATTVFGAFNTLIIGAYLTDADIAFWSVASQIVSAAQSLYGPINSGIYPHMIREKSLGLIRKVLMIFMPLILIAVAISYHFGEWFVTIVAGDKYLAAVVVFRQLLPLLIISFPSMLIGWPCLGAIDKQNEVTLSTMVSAVVQIVLIVVFIFVNKLTLTTIVISRLASETVLLAIRAFFVLKNKTLFSLDG